MAIIDNVKPTREIKKLKSFSELLAIIETPIECPFELDGQRLSVPVIRETAAITDRVRAIVRAVQPPYDKVRGEYDPLNQTYLKARDEAEGTARCLRVYYCVPMIAAERPGLASDKEIVEFIKAKVPVHLQELFAATAQLGGMRQVLEGANFTEAPGLAES